MSIYASPLLFNAVLGLFLAYYVFRNGYAPGARALGMLILAATAWSFGYALEFLASDLAVKVFWAKFQYFGIVSIAPAWLIFSTRLLSPPEEPVRWRSYLLLLAVVPALTLALVWTNESHGLIWYAVRLSAGGATPFLELEHGAGFWVFWAFSYVLMAWGSARMLQRLLGAVRLHRWQITLALLAIVIPWLGNLAYISGRSPLEHLDLTPFGFTVAGLFFTITLFRFRLVNILPIAQETVFAGLADCILVVDARDRIADLNPAARKLAAPEGGQPVGAPLARVVPYG